MATKPRDQEVQPGNPDVDCQDPAEASTARQDDLQSGLDDYERRRLLDRTEP